eukprot:gb/GECG01005311.1/.p1 GENE.gb/GECG01005311.1/~~gb/GECG01005311.1/.p1  ORF type:complete len:658 (+),score=85.63 gb/GECG01005311.1/:1-1974(+)
MQAYDEFDCGNGASPHSHASGYDSTSSDDSASGRQSHIEPSIQQHTTICEAGQNGVRSDQGVHGSSRQGEHNGRESNTEKSPKDLNHVLRSLKRSRKKVRIPGIGEFHGSAFRASDLRKHGVVIPFEGMKWVPHGTGSSLDDRSSSEYEGQWRLGKMHGKGTRHFFTGDVYDGEFQEGLRHGRGTYLFMNSGDKYVGEWQKGLMHGNGTFYFACGDVYDGQWNHGKMSGSATKKLANGDEVVSDQWCDGLVHGYARKIFCRGDTYEGYFSQDDREGFGKYTWAHGESVEGEWKGGRLCGSACKRLPNGAVYRGHFLDDKMEGQGIQEYNNGDFYSGELYENKRHGFGHYMFADGSSYSGTWKHGRMHGRGLKEDLANETTYYGEWDHGTPTGRGTQTYERVGDKYIGEFVGGARHGNGVYIWRDSSRLKGSWNSGRPHGHCKISSVSGLVERGYWCHGVKTGWFRYSFRTKRLDRAMQEDEAPPAGISYFVLSAYRLLREQDALLEIYYGKGDPTQWRLVSRSSVENSLAPPSLDGPSNTPSFASARGLLDWEVWESQASSVAGGVMHQLPPQTDDTLDNSVAVAASTGSPLFGSHQPTGDMPPPLSLSAASDAPGQRENSEIGEGDFIPLRAPLLLQSPPLPSKDQLVAAISEKFR